MSLSMQGKTVLVTGATAGIGQVTARELAAMGAQVTLVSRNPHKLAAVAEQIRTQTKNGAIETIAADLSVKTGAQTTAHEFKKRHTHLDVLVNNAGAIFFNRQVSKDGIEMTFALNHLAYFHLTILLLDVLKASGPARVINVSSDAHRGQKIDFENLQGERAYNGMTAYGRSKLMNVLCTYELARRIEGTSVTANAIHPGFVASNFARNNGLMANVAMRLIGVFGRSPEEGADTIIYTASAQEVAGMSGMYFYDRKAVQSDRSSYDETAAGKLWETSLEMMV